jgi:glyoxylase-like metal-dependent hydrolase (beta-lactamase superfamily II)
MSGLDGDISRIPKMGHTMKYNLSDIRSLAALQLGQLPVAINAVKVAASVRPNKFVIEGGDETPTSMPRTAFQVVFPDRTVMLDSGLDQATHDSFSQGEKEPYYPAEFEKLATALQRAGAIIFTHYHADHIAGVVCASNREELANKTFTTRLTSRLMVETPHRPHLALTPDDIRNFIIFDYEDYYPIMPGIVMIKTPGHSPDSQMIFIRLQNGQEYLHSVDTAWNMQNIIQMKGKAAAWVKENKEQIGVQLKWLNGLLSTEPDLALLVTHDDDQLAKVMAEGLVGELEV